MPNPSIHEGRSKALAPAIISSSCVLGKAGVRLTFAIFESNAAPRASKSPTNLNMGRSFVV